MLDLDGTKPISRREALRIAAVAAATAMAASCRPAPSVETTKAAPGRLFARPASPTLSPSIGRSALGLASGRDGILYVPASYNAAARAPLVLMLHGTSDRILPIDNCGRRLAARLTAAGYVVEFREFTGPHAVPPDVARAAVEWLERN